MKKILILALFLFLAVDVWLFILLFKPGALKFSFNKSFKAGQISTELLPIDKPLMYLPGSALEFSPPTVKLKGTIKKVTVQGNKLYIDIQLEKNSRTSVLSVFAIEPVVTLHADKGDIPLKQFWKGEGASELKKSLKINDPVIIEIPYVTPSDVNQLQKSACPSDYCKDYVRLMETAMAVNKKTIDKWESTGTIDSHSVVGPLNSIILYE